MKVKDFISQLKHLDQNAVVILASDAEGNSFNELDEIWSEEGLRFDPENNEIVNISGSEYSKEELKEVKDSTQKAIILFPI